jgi:hypothetical protein
LDEDGNPQKSVCDDMLHAQKPSSLSFLPPPSS